MSATRKRTTSKTTAKPPVTNAAGAVEVGDAVEASKPARKPAKTLEDKAEEMVNGKHLPCKNWLVEIKNGGDNMPAAHATPLVVRNCPDTGEAVRVFIVTKRIPEKVASNYRYVATEM